MMGKLYVFPTGALPGRKDRSNSKGLSTDRALGGEAFFVLMITNIYNLIFNFLIVDFHAFFPCIIFSSSYVI